VVGVLREAGYTSAAQVVAADPADLAGTGLDEETVQAVLEAAQAAADADRTEVPAEPDTETQSHS